MFLALIFVSFSAHAMDSTLATETDLKVWKLRRENEGVKTFLPIKPGESKFSMARGEVIIPVPLTRAIAAFSDLSVRKDWFDGAKEVKLLSQSEKNGTRVEYLREAVPWPYHDRYFVIRIHPIPSLNPKQVFFVVDNADPSLVKKPESLEYAKIVHEYFFMKEVDANHTKIGVETSVDPGGNVPVFFVNMISDLWPYHTLQNLQKILPTNQSPIDARILQFFSPTVASQK